MPKINDLKMNINVDVNIKTHQLQEPSPHTLFQWDKYISEEFILEHVAEFDFDFSNPALPDVSLFGKWFPVDQLHYDYVTGSQQRQNTILSATLLSIGSERALFTITKNLTTGEAEVLNYVKIHE